jgi:hypothetical protein
MTLTDFLKLSDDRKMRAMLQKAVVIASIKTWREERLLFQIEAFYVEVTFGISGALLDIKAFDNTDDLAPYLEQMNISL